MANSLLTPTTITREALRVLHGQLTFIGGITREYDDQYAKKGAKIGSSLNIRLPNQFTVTDGPNLALQDVTEQSVQLSVTNQKHVDFSFSSGELTLNIDDFSKRYIQPAMAQLAASLEADAFNMINDVNQVVNGIGSAITFKNVLQSRKLLKDALMPTDKDASLILNTQDNVDLVDTLKGLFQDSNEIATQYREGLMGRTGGYDILESTLIPSKATGTAAIATGYTVNGASQQGSSITVATGATTFKKGDVVTFVGCNRVHPETKLDTGTLMQFVVTADYAGGAGNLQIAPAIVSSATALQNVAASPTNGGAVAKVGAANAVYRPSLAFHKSAFAFATADLVLPQNQEFAAREVYDGISMRIIRQYNINNDTFPCRIDVLYGYKTLRAQLAARILSN